MEKGKTTMALDNQDKQSMTLRKLMWPSLITMAISGCCSYIPEYVRSRQTNVNGHYGVFLDYILNMLFDHMSSSLC